MQQPRSLEQERASSLEKGDGQGPSGVTNLHVQMQVFINQVQLKGDNDKKPTSVI